MTCRVLAYTPTWDDAMRHECKASIESQKIDGELMWVAGRVNPFPIGDHRNVLRQYMNARSLALEGGFDALLTFEHDQQMPDASALERLINTAGDVIYAPYVFRGGARKLNVLEYSDKVRLGSSLCGAPRTLLQAREAGAWRVSGVGFGCTLIRRHVLEAIAFRGDGLQWAPDIPFAEDALYEGFISMAQFSVPVGHYDGQRWLWPEWIEGKP